MKKVILSVAVSLFAASLAPTAIASEQQNKMKECLSAKPANKGSTQQEKMKSCNKEAGEKALKGDDRKKFMSGCLKG